MDVVARVEAEPMVLEPRMADAGNLWVKLLTAAVSNRRDVRIAARVSALQTVLTASTDARYRSLASAACRLPAARMRVADRSQR